MYHPVSLHVLSETAPAAASLSSEQAVVLQANGGITVLSNHHTAENISTNRTFDVFIFLGDSNAGVFPPESFHFIIISLRGIHSPVLRASMPVI